MALFFVRIFFFFFFFFFFFLNQYNYTLYKQLNKLKEANTGDEDKTHYNKNTKHRITGSTLARHLSDNAKSTTLHIKYKKETYSDKGL